MTRPGNGCYLVGEIYYRYRRPLNRPFTQPPSHLATLCQAQTLTLDQTRIKVKTLAATTVTGHKSLRNHPYTRNPIQTAIRYSFSLYIAVYSHLLQRKKQT